MPRRLSLPSGRQPARHRAVARRGYTRRIRASTTRSGSATSAAFSEARPYQRPSRGPSERTMLSAFRFALWLLGNRLRPLLVLRREPPDPMPVAHVAALATYAASHETPLNRLMSGLAIGQVRADVGAGSAAGSGQVRVGAAWAQRGVLAAQVAADVISTAARTCMSFATQQLVGTLSLDSDLPSTCKRVSVRIIEADA
ncbi:hypothetical protein M885DRAFT_553439, partial [Pelagophyceae sp. CCMP2097]